MRKYLTKDWMYDLTEKQILTAQLLIGNKTFDNTDGWDNVATIEGNGPLPRLDDVIYYDNFVYIFNADEGATYDIYSMSYYDPHVKVYDQYGNVIESDYDTTNNEVYEVNGVVNNVNTISKWVAPYTGIYYVNPGWELGFNEFEKSYSLTIYEDLDTITTEPMEAKAGRIFNWLEYNHRHLNIHPESQMYDGYYARFYQDLFNIYALGEKDGNIYYYNSEPPDGRDPITFIGTVSDLLPQAMAEGF